MKRLLRVSFDSAFFSFIPILSWFVLGILVDKNLINVFTITYPIQFICALLKCIFGVAPNIGKEKENDSNAVMSGIVIGSIIGLIVFGIFVINIDSYLQFMNADPMIYRTFTLYSIISLYIQLIFGLIIQKLYFEDRNKDANKYTISFNLLNFIVLTLSSILFENQYYILITTISAILIYVIFMLFKESEKFNFSFKIFKYIKYDSVDICNNILFFIIFILGLSNANSFGAEYMLALNFVALITDTQWDAFDAISTVAKIDISKNKFNYIEHRKNAYKLLLLLMITSLIMFSIMHSFYNLNLLLVGIYFLFELVNFIIYPSYRIKTCFLQLEYSSVKTTINKFIASFGRTLISLLKTPFCTGIGQCTSSIYQFISINIIFKRNFVIVNDGTIKLKKEN